MSYSRSFTEIYEIVKAIPSGKVMSYGQVAAEIHTNARTVGWAMGAVSDVDIPWHRVVAADGYLSIGRRSPELLLTQRALLEREGVQFLPNGHVDMTAFRHYGQDDKT